MATITGLARQLRVDVTTDLTLSSGWTQIFGLTSVDPQITPDAEDASDYTTNGWGSSEVTMQDWTLELNWNEKITSGTIDAGQSIVAACRGKFGTSARCGVRWYDNVNSTSEAWSGVGLLTSYKRANTTYKDLEAVDATLTGTDVALTQIANPAAGVGAPVVLAATPSGAGTGALVEITGTGFTGTVATTGVKFGATSATSWIVASDQLIVAIVPSGSAGATTVTVTNAVGVSNSLAYTRAS